MPEQTTVQTYFEVTAVTYISKQNGEDVRHVTPGDTPDAFRVSLCHRFPGRSQVVRNTRATCATLAGALDFARHCATPDLNAEVRISRETIAALMNGTQRGILNADIPSFPADSKFWLTCRPDSETDGIIAVAHVGDQEIPLNALAFTDAAEFERMRPLLEAYVLDTQEMARGHLTVLSEIASPSGDPTFFGLADVDEKLMCGIRKDCAEFFWNQVEWLQPLIDSMREPDQRCKAEGRASATGAVSGMFALGRNFGIIRNGQKSALKDWSVAVREYGDLVAEAELFGKTPIQVGGDGKLQMYVSRPNISRPR